MLRDLENHRSRHSRQRARGSITETTHRCPQTPLQPRSSGQSAPRSHRTLLPTDAQPQARHRHVLQSTLRAIGANLRAGSSAGTGTHAEASTREATAALTALQRERCKLVGTERAVGCSAPAAGPGSTCKPPEWGLAPTHSVGVPVSSEAQAAGRQMENST